MRGVALALAALVSVVGANGEDLGPCPNMCSGNGKCMLSNCECFKGFRGGDCSERVCPMAAAWSDAATAVDVAHNLAECSNRGKCDRATGSCACDFGFTGRACEMRTCPNDCLGKGRCLDMRYNAKYKDPGLGQVYLYEDVWDARKMYGCSCDDGFHGYDCSLRSCPMGDDPMTENQVNEVQLIQCTATSGFFTLTFQGQTSEPIPTSTGLADFEAIIEAIPSLGDVDVTFSDLNLPVCMDPSISNQIVAITFLQNFGNVNSLVVLSTHINSCSHPDRSRYDLCGGSQVIVATDGLSLTPSVGSPLLSVSGTKEQEFCSHRGRCDKETGVCSCFVNFVTSNGAGDEGIRGDCGFASAEIQACPGLISCSGHGVCSQATQFRCSCSIGWASGDCSVRTCPKGKSWFDIPIADNRAHQLVECSNMGTCDTVSGICSCHPGFTGAACEQMVCPGDPLQCSGHGACLSMGQLAHHALVNGDLVPTTYGVTPNDPHTWDYDMVHGCVCDSGFEGHNCALRTCPKGDDPETDGQVHEIQAIVCTADAGSAVLYFRTHFTEPIPHDASVEQLKEKLTGLASITDIDITYSTGETSFCNGAGSNVVKITFTQELGELPNLRAYHSTNGADLDLSGSTPAIQVYAGGAVAGTVTTRRGTFENLECSGRGVCNYETGKCRCFSGYGSSDGNGGAGIRGDCGFRVPWVQDVSSSSSSSSSSSDSNPLTFSF